MIPKEEIEQKSEEFGIHVANVERDYVFGWLLAGIYGESSLQNQLILKGGNCFRKAYFPHTRFSNDLDFSTQTGVHAQSLIEELNKVSDLVQARTGIIFDKHRNNVQEKGNADRERKIYEARLYFKDFYGNPDAITISVRLDVTEYDRIYLPIQSRYLVHPYSDADQCRVQVRCQKLEELLAAKLKCLLQRRHSSDLYDFVFSVFLNKELEVQRGEIVSTFLKKTIFESSPGVVRGLLLDLPFQVLRGLWDKYLVCPRVSLIGFDAVVVAFKETIEALFGRFAGAIGRQFAFFPSHFRNPIMEAAGSLTLLQVVYDGQSRLVEPYSLVFKRRQDGIAREYFCVYDRTGGYSGPGIKAFVLDKVGSIQNTTEKFEPRFPVELSKAGEPASKGYFGSPFGRPRAIRPSVGRARIRWSSGASYTVECSYCSKRFKRTKPGTRLNKHKDRFGNDCYGRAGFLVCP
jgi:predicted nucleotidyltransferase component of viral defense system